MEIEAVGLPAVAQVADPVSADAEIEKVDIKLRIIRAEIRRNEQRIAVAHVADILAVPVHIGYAVALKEHSEFFHYIFLRRRRAVNDSLDNYIFISLLLQQFGTNFGDVCIYKISCPFL